MNSAAKDAVPVTNVHYDPNYQPTRTLGRE